MMKAKKFISIICGMFFTALVICAQTLQSPADFVCRISPSENDSVYKMLKDAEADFSSRKRSEEVSVIKNFLSGEGNMGIVVRDAAGKKYVLSVGTEGLSSFTRFDICFASETSSALKDLKLSALDSQNNFLLVELPETYAGKALGLSNVLPTVGQRVVVPNFTSNRLEVQPAMVTDVRSNNFLHSAKDALAGSPVLLSDMSSGSSYTLLGMNRPSKSDSDSIYAEFVYPTLSDFVKNWRNVMLDDVDLPLNLFLSMVTSPSSNSDRIAARFISTKLLTDSGVDIYLSKVNDSYSFKSNFRANPHTGLAYVTASCIKRVFGGSSSFFIDSMYIYENTAKVAFSDGEKTIQSAWVRENGLWKISELEGLESFIKKKRSGGSDWFGEDYFGDPYILNIKGSFLVPTETDTKGFDVAAMLNAQFFGIGLFYQQEKLVMELSSGPEERNAYTFGAIYRVQAPFDLWRFIVIPYVEGRLGITNIHELFDDKSSRLYFGVDYGLDLCFSINTTFAPYVSISGNSVSYNDRERSNNVSLTAGLRLFGFMEDWVW